MRLPSFVITKISVNLSTLKSPNAAIMPSSTPVNNVSVTSVKRFDVHKAKLINRSEIIIRILSTDVILVTSRDFAFLGYGTPLK